jgi:hypothetical protein
MHILKIKYFEHEFFMKDHVTIYVFYFAAASFSLYGHPQGDQLRH